MLFLSILFLVIGSGFIIYGFSLINTGYVTHQEIKYIVFILGFICLSTGSILLALRQISNHFYELLDFIKSKKNNEIAYKEKSELEETKICPFCAGKIKKDATVCSFCGRTLNIVKSQKTETIPNKSNNDFDKTDVSKNNNAAPHCEQKGICTPLKPQDDDWFCFYCGIRNRYGAIKCRCCGNTKQHETSEVISIPKFIFSDHKEIINTFITVKEIYDYLLNLNIQDNNFNDKILPDIKKLVEMEKLYGNMYNDAINILNKFE